MKINKILKMSKEAAKNIMKELNFEKRKQRRLTRKK